MFMFKYTLLGSVHFFLSFSKTLKTGVMADEIQHCVTEINNILNYINKRNNITVFFCIFAAEKKKRNCISAISNK